ncbi:MAG TPA: Uma2 family endonuclease [Pirellulales bacterium]|jgi:Uma2 family endonuclease|nr:Uma2 family endonuclease [Pirellulales bacterium]
MSISTTPITAEQLWAMPTDGGRRELVKGELIRMNPAGGEHGVVVAELTWRLGQHVRQHDLGRVFGAETGFVLTRDPDTVRAPDIAFVRQERIAVTGIPQAYFPGAPDLAVEVVSPSDRVNDVDTKVDGWLSHGCQLVWVVNPRRRTVAVYRSVRDTRVMGEADTLEAPDLLPGWQLAVAAIFPPA